MKGLSVLPISKVNICSFCFWPQWEDRPVHTKMRLKHIASHVTEKINFVSGLESEERHLSLHLACNFSKAISIGLTPQGMEVPNTAVNGHEVGHRGYT